MDQPSECPICYDLPATTKLYSCSHLTCSVCAAELAWRFADCPQCRRPATSYITLSDDFEILTVSLHVNTAMQSPVYLFGLPHEVRRSMRHIRRSGNYDAFKKDIFDHAVRALVQHGVIADPASLF